MALGILIVIFGFGIFVLIGFILYAIGAYNSLIQLKNNIKKSWSNINVLLKQRTDELRKLINTVKGYMKHEKGTFEVITKARAGMMKAKTRSDKAAADNMITSALKTLFAVSENYPELKANEGFQKLQTRISGIENELADRREFYNDSVNQFNIRIQSFPDMIVAKFMKLQEQELFKISEEDKKDVEVKF